MYIGLFTEQKLNLKIVSKNTWIRRYGQAFLVKMVKTYILITTDLMTFLLVSKPMSTTMSMKDLMDAVVTTLHFYHIAL